MQRNDSAIEQMEESVAYMYTGLRRLAAEVPMKDLGFLEATQARKRGSELIRSRLSL